MFGSQFDPACFNSYLYVPDNPAAFADPLGLAVGPSYSDCIGYAAAGYFLATNALDRAWLWVGDNLVPGASEGQAALEWYAAKYVETDRPFYFAGGCIAALWTPGTWVQTTVTLAAGLDANAAIKVSRAAQAASCPSVGGATTPRPPGWNSNWELRDSSRTISNKSRWDPQGGEWHYHPAGADQWHPDPHWDYNPWEQWNNPWQNVPLGD